MKVFVYGSERLIAKDRNDAKRILRAECGEVKDALLKRAKPPFMLVVDSGKPFEVGESEYCKRISTYGDGMVYRD